ncbi:ABC transporter, ATP-binding protein, putative [Gloeomargarita lithophora Alchichica-D10]|uniref:ABC transporter, ATP-binding protein, putative n=1 Tax=Gloeomargarita lithophora Alchichica-D10 TaxID=1188229 RepID=A0A1J0ACU9_9CYAN|nr:ATP-binding cassette domain-containing protein [Gloeomargarita lithophora]APB33762.1 ABC transporter, ATP-binding protein, putative [Gloeomargarita lithophora Alchichica-D10]
MHQPIIEFRDVYKQLGGRTILNGVNFAIYPGEAVGVIGPSGAGKSTTLRLIAGLMAPDAGEVWVQGKPQVLVGEGEISKAHIGMVFQGSALFDSLTVAENVGFLLSEHTHSSPERVQDLVELSLERVGLKGIGERYPAELSGGMRRRVALARAIIEDPEDEQDDLDILLYDEPTAGLDPVASRVIEDLMRNLQKEVQHSATYVVVTHQESTIRRGTDRILLLYNGQIQWQGKVQELDTTNDPYITQFMSGDTIGPITMFE